MQILLSVLASPRTRVAAARAGLRGAALALLLAVAATAPGHAADPVYIQPGQVDLIKVLPPAPAPGSPTTVEDFRILRELQASRTPEEIKAAEADVLRSLDRFSAAVGTNLSSTAAPVANAVFDRAWNQAYTQVAAVKDYWNRERPYLVNPAVRLAVAPENTPSYPSGHATYGTLTAILLAAIVPEKAGVIFDRGAQFGVERLIGGVHYPSDVEAGHIAGSILAVELLRSAAFQADLARAAAEVRAALGLPPLTPAMKPVPAPEASPSMTAVPVMPLPALAAP